MVEINKTICLLYKSNCNPFLFSQCTILDYSVLSSKTLRIILFIVPNSAQRGHWKYIIDHLRAKIHLLHRSAIFCVALVWFTVTHIFSSAYFRTYLLLIIVKWNNKITIQEVNDIPNWNIYAKRLYTISGIRSNFKVELSFILFVQFKNISNTRKVTAL